MRKLALYASLAIAAAAFAIPSTASAVWTQNHADIAAGTNPVLHGEGNLAFVAPVGGISCTQVTSTVQLTGGTTTAHTQQFTPTLASCKGTGGLASCVIKSITVEGLPWTGHITSTVGTKTGVKLQQHLSGFLCPPTIQLVSTEQHDIVLQPVETGTVGGHTTTTTTNIGGSLKLIETGSTATAQGTLVPTSGGSHKYGFT